MRQTYPCKVRKIVREKVSSGLDAYLYQRDQNVSPRWTSERTKRTRYDLMILGIFALLSANTPHPSLALNPVRKCSFPAGRKKSRLLPVFEMRKAPTMESDVMDIKSRFLTDRWQVNIPQTSSSLSQPAVAWASEPSFIVCSLFVLHQ